MGEKAVLAVTCWLALSQALGDKVAVTQSAVKDNESAASAPRLYRNVPLGVYASAAPYAAYSFQLPQFIAAPKASASQVAPVKQKTEHQTVNTYLMDSYGNRFMETPQLASYKAAFPQQYVALQSKLPEHLAQPLVAASPNFQFKQSAPQVFFGAPFRVPALQSPAPTPLNHFPNFGRLVYAENVQSLAPASNVQNHAFGAPTAHQQSTNNNAVFANSQPHEQYRSVKHEPQYQRQQEAQIIVGKPKFQNSQEIPSAPQGKTKFQGIQEKPRGAYGEKFQRIQEVPQVQSASQYQRTQEKLHTPYEQTKFQRIQETPREAYNGEKYQLAQQGPQVVHVEHIYERLQDASKHEQEKSHATRNENAQLQSAPAKQTTITYVNDIDGQKSVVKVQSEPLPLLDLTLLEPLTFANPLVPQVQHFLPRINQATYQKLPQASIDDVKNYQKEFVVQKTMSYDSGNISEKPQKDTPKKKQKKPTQFNKHLKKNDAPKTTAVPTHHETLEDAPEIVYEINTPGHKETYKEKVVSYNKETQAEPVHYSYGSESEKDPINYSYSRTIKEPVQTKEVHYHSNGQGPAHLIYNFKPEEHSKKEQHTTHNTAPHINSESHKDSSPNSEDQDPRYHHHHTKHYDDHPKSSEDHHEPNHKSQEHYHRSSQGSQHESLNAGQAKPYHSAPAQHTEQIDFAPITKEYEEDIRLLANAQIKVDPSQHGYHPKSTYAPPPQRDSEGHVPERHHDLSHQKNSHEAPVHQNHHHYSAPHSESHNSPAAHVHEKSKRIIIHEESPDEMHVLREQMKQEVLNREENNEEDFEKAYKDAAIGFPAYNKQALDAAEKDIFDPESYGVPPHHVEYDIEHTPFQQYQEDGDDFPKESRSIYKDARDKTKENYYTDYSISKPESLLDRYQNKLGYYKLYKQQKPDYYVSDGDGDNKKKQKQKFAKYSVAPSFDYPSTKEEKEISYYGHHKPKQQLYEYDYSKGAPRDNSAFASRPYQRYKSKTNFVEPQFQYGFEPISIPKLLDSELAAMASNQSPESERPGMRKKVYKENWYIKKTSTSAGAPAS